MGRNLNDYNELTKIEQPGVYEVIIISAKDKQDKNGNDICMVTFQTADGKIQFNKYDYSNEFGFILKDLCRKAKLTEAEIADFDPSMLLNREVKIVINKDKTGLYLNVTAIMESESQPTMPAAQQPEQNSDVPF